MKSTKKPITLTSAFLAAAFSLTFWKAHAQEDVVPYDMIGIVRCPELAAQFGENRSGIGGIDAPVPNNNIFVRQVDNILANDKYTDVSGPTLFVDQSSHRFTLIYWNMIALDRHKFIGGDDDYYLMHEGPKSYYQVGAVIINADASDNTLKLTPTIIKYGVNPLAQIQDEMNQLPHNQICERHDRLSNPVCVAYNKNIEILTKRQEAIKDSMSEATKKAKAGLQHVLTNINRCVGNWATLHKLNF